MQLQKWLFNYISANNGFGSWQEIKEAYSLGELAEANDRLKILLQEERSSSETDINIQKILLDLYAEAMGFGSWEGMLATSFKEQSYACFGDILTADESSFTLEQLGWESLRDEAKYLSKMERDFLIIDSTDLRLMPELVCRELSNKLGIKFNYEMIGGWQEGDFSHFITQQLLLDQKDQFVWYDTLSQSRGVKLPTEKSPLLSAFPQYVQEYIKNIAMPIYVDFFTSISKISIEGNTPKDFSLRDIDPIHFLLSENRRLLDQVLLNLIFFSVEQREEGDFKGRRK